MPTCAIKWCGKNSKTSNYKTDGITFHKFPRDPNLKQKWIEITRRENWFPAYYSRVCSRHFSEDCFHLMKSGFRRLFNTAIPTKHLPVVGDTTMATKSNDLTKDQDCTKSSSSSFEHQALVTTSPKTLKQKSIALVTASQFESMNISQKIGFEEQDCTKTSITKCQPILTTPKRQKRKITDLVSPSQFDSPIKKRLCRRIIELSGKVSQKNYQLKNLRSKVGYFKKRVASLNVIVNDLEKKSLINSENADILNKIGVHNREIVQRQISRTKTGKVIRKKYSPELRTFALTLNFYSTKAYKYVRKTFSTCLPSLRTLSKWYKTVDGRPGFTTEAFNALKNKAIACRNNLICTLVFDEMKIKNKVEYEPYSQRTFGYVDFGSQLETDCNNECTEALVFLVVPINGRFKVPIGYFLVDKTSGEQKANLVLQAIQLCHENKVDIKALTFDGCPANLAMANHLGCNLKKHKLETCFKNPATGANVYVYLDPVHMLKLLRNTFEHYRILQDEQGHSIKWNYIKELHELQERENFHLANKLRAEHIGFKCNVMKVKLASQLFSRSVATALDFCDNKLKLASFQGVAATSRMILLINDLFDILDSRVHGYGFKRALNEENHIAVFEKLEECKHFLMSVTANIRVRNREKITKLIDSPRFTGFLGFCVAIESTKGMFKDLICDERYPLKYLPMHKISQDHIELFFANIRSHGGSNDNPTPRLFEAIYKKCLIYTELLQTTTGNCIPLEKIPILNCSSAIARINLTTTQTEDFSDSLHEIESQEDINIAMESVELSQFSENVIEYIAGYVSSALLKRIKCGTCIEALVSLSENKRSLIFYRDKGGLIYPSTNVQKICRRCEQFIKSLFMTSNNKRKITSDFLVHKTLSSFTGGQLFHEYQFHQYHADETNHIIDLSKSIMKKYIDTRLAFLSKRKTFNEKEAVRRIYTKLIHFKNQ